jgi:hypothetical protein
MFHRLAAISVFAGALCAQQKLSPGMTYHRVWMVTPLQGTGKAGDPQRPMFVPASGAAAAATGDRSGVLGFQMQLSDDGRFALVEYVFASPAAFQAVLQSEAAARGISVPTATVAPSPVPSPTTISPGTVSKVLSQTGGVSTAGTTAGTTVTAPAAPAAGPSAAQTALQSAIPGLAMFERGSAAQSDVLAAFQKYKQNFQFSSFTVRVQ